MNQSLIEKNIFSERSSGKPLENIHKNIFIQLNTKGEFVHVSKPNFL